MATGMSTAPKLLFQLAIRRLDCISILALSLCFVAGSFQWLVLPTIAQHAQRLEAESIRAANDAPPADNATLDSQRYRSFQARLAAPADRATLLKQVFAHASAAGIPLAQGDYALIAEPEGGYDRLQIMLPLKGTYPQIRAFVDGMLEEIPAISLDEISFRRDSIKSTNIEVRLRLTLYLRVTD